MVDHNLAAALPSACRSVRLAAEQPQQQQQQPANSSPTHFSLSPTVPPVVTEVQDTQHRHPLQLTTISSSKERCAVCLRLFKGEMLCCHKCRYWLCGSCSEVEYGGGITADSLDHPALRPSSVLQFARYHCHVVRVWEGRLRCPVCDRKCSTNAPLDTHHYRCTLRSCTYKACERCLHKPRKPWTASSTIRSLLDVMDTPSAADELPLVFQQLTDEYHMLNMGQLHHSGQLTAAQQDSFDAAQAVQFSRVVAMAPAEVQRLRDERKMEAVAAGELLGAFLLRRDFPQQWQDVCVQLAMLQRPTEAEADVRAELERQWADWGLRWAIVGGHSHPLVALRRSVARCDGCGLRAAWRTWYCFRPTCTLVLCGRCEDNQQRPADDRDAVADELFSRQGMGVGTHNRFILPTMQRLEREGALVQATLSHLYHPHPAPQQRIADEQLLAEHADRAERFARLGEEELQRLLDRQEWRRLQAAHVEMQLIASKRHASQGKQRWVTLWRLCRAEDEYWHTMGGQRRPRWDEHREQSEWLHGVNLTRRGLWPPYHPLTDV